MLLIFPPVAKPGEPPAGIAKLAGALKAHDVSCGLLDMNIEGLLYLLHQPATIPDTWTRRAIKNSSKNIAALRDPLIYQSPDRYRRAVIDLNRVLEAAGRDFNVVAGLADYQDRVLSPVRSADLIHAAEHPEKNLFHHYFEKRLPEMIAKACPARPASAGGGHCAGRNEKIEEPASDRKEQVSLIGFSLNYLSQALCTFAMIGFIKKEFPHIRIVLGGGLITSWIKRPGWKNPFTGLVDHLIAGPGEGPLLSLLGVIGVKQGHYPPEYDFLPLQSYISPGLVLPYNASSGCYWNKCSFCPEPAEANPYIPVPVHDVIADLNCLAARKKPVIIHLLDSSVSPAVMRALSEKQAGAPWYGFARIHPDLTDVDFCIALKRSGCRMLKLGLESGDQGVLDALQKGIDLDMASKVLKNLQRAGIATYVYVLFGTPVETEGQARKTLDFIVRHKEAVTFLNLAIFNMPVCGVEAGKYNTEPFYQGDLSLYTNFRHPGGWDRKLVRQFLDNEFKRHPAISAILKKDPPLFTSNHAAFFTTAVLTNNLHADNFF